MPVKTQICVRMKEETSDSVTRTEENFERTRKSTIVKAVPGIAALRLKSEPHGSMSIHASLYACVRVCVYVLHMYMCSVVCRVAGS